MALQVAHLQAENSSLSNRLNEIGRKYNEAAVDNRVLKSDVEALRAKVCLFSFLFPEFYFNLLLR